jgi:hypothetical protein
MHEASFIEKTSQTERRPPDEAGIPPVGWSPTSVLAFTWVASCLLLSLAIVGWLGFQLAQGGLAWGEAWLGLVAGFLLWAGLGVLAQLLEVTSGVVVTRADAPALFDALDRLKSQLKGPRIERVLLDTQFHIGIRQARRFGRFGGKMNCLAIGLPLMLALDRRRLLALLAHEYARFHGGRGRLAQWFYQGLPPLRFRSLSPRGLARERQSKVNADRVARKLLGRHVAAAALIELTVKAEWAKHEFWPGHWRAAAASMLPVAPYAAMRVLAIMPPHEDFAQECLRQALALSGDSKDGLLLLRDRLDALRAKRQLPLWSSSQAIHMLGDRGTEWLAAFDLQWCQGNAAEWKLHRAYLSRVRARGQFLAARFRECSADELVEIAELMLRLDVDADVRSLYERVLQLAPGHPGALRGLVRCLPDAEWELRVARASALFDNSEAHRCWASRAAVMTLEKHAGEHGDNAELQRWHERRDVAEQIEHEAMRELAESPYLASIESSDLREFEKGELLSRLARCTPVARAWLVRKRLAHFSSRRCYIIFLDLPGLRHHQRDGVCRELESTLELPGLTLAVSAGRAPPLSEIKRRAFEPVYVRVPAS